MTVERLTRYHRVRAMRAEGFSWHEIGRRIGRSPIRAKQIHDDPHGGAEATIDPRYFDDLRLEVRRDKKREELVGVTARWRALRAELRLIEDELLVRQNDRILGLRPRT